MSTAVLDDARLEERQRHKAILQHPAVLQGAFDLGVFLATATDLSVEEAHKCLDKAHTREAPKTECMILDFKR